MAKENISQEFRFKNIDETRNYLIEEINRNELMSKNVCFFFFSWYSNTNYEFCNGIKDLCNNCKN